MAHPKIDGRPFLISLCSLSLSVQDGGGRRGSWGRGRGGILGGFEWILKLVTYTSSAGYVRALASCRDCRGIA